MVETYTQRVVRASLAPRTASAGPGPIAVPRTSTARPVATITVAHRAGLFTPDPPAFSHRASHRGTAAFLNVSAGFAIQYQLAAANGSDAMNPITSQTIVGSIAVLLTRLAAPPICRAASTQPDATDRSRTRRSRSIAAGDYRGSCAHPASLVTEHRREHQAECEERPQVVNFQLLSERRLCEDRSPRPSCVAISHRAIPDTAQENPRVSIHQGDQVESRPVLEPGTADRESHTDGELIEITRERVRQVRNELAGR